MVKSINLVKRLAKNGKSTYSALEFDLGYKKHLIFLSAADIQVIFDITDRQLADMTVGDIKPLLISNK